MGSTERDRLHPARPLHVTCCDSDLCPGIPDGLPGQWYRLVSSGFLHYGILHLASTCTRCTCSARRSSRCSAGCGSAWSTSRACSAAAPGRCCCQPHGLHGGASGAVFGLFGLIIVGYLQRGINPLTTALGGVLIVNVLLSFRGGISFGGHLGGAVAGMICGWVMMAPAQRRVAGELDLHHADPRRAGQYRCGSCHNALTPPGVSRITSCARYDLGRRGRNLTFR